MAPILEASHAIQPDNPFAYFEEIAVEAILWIVARFHNAGETILSICYLPSSFVGWIVQVSTGALEWLYAIFITTVEIIILVAGTLVGFLLVLLLLVAVCKTPSSGWIYTGQASRRVVFVPAMDQSIHEREGKWGSVDQTCYGTMDSIPSGTAVSRTKIEESCELGWRHAIWQNVTRHSYGSRGSTNVEGVQGVVQTRDEKSDKHSGD